MRRTGIGTQVWVRYATRSHMQPLVSAGSQLQPLASAGSQLHPWVQRTAGGIQLYCVLAVFPFIKINKYSRPGHRGSRRRQLLRPLPGAGFFPKWGRYHSQQ